MTDEERKDEEKVFSDIYAWNPETSKFESIGSIDIAVVENFLMNQLRKIASIRKASSRGEIYGKGPLADIFKEHDEMIEIARELVVRHDNQVRSRRMRE